MSCPKCKKLEAVAQDALKRAEAIAAMAKRDSANQRQAVLDEFRRLNQTIDKLEAEQIELQRDFDKLCNLYNTTDDKRHELQTELNLTKYFLTNVLAVDGVNGLNLRDCLLWVNARRKLGPLVGTRDSYKLSIDEFLSLVWATHLVRKKRSRVKFT